MVEKNYKVALVEQVETSRQALARSAKGDFRLTGLPKLPKYVIQRAEEVSRREISQIFSRGTFVPQIEDTEIDFGSESRTVICITALENSINAATASTTEIEKGIIELGICYFDLSCLTCTVGILEDNVALTKLRAILNQTKPIEVVCKTNGLNLVPRVKRLVISHKIQVGCMITELPLDKCHSIGGV